VDGPNLFGYVRGNPVRSKDPSGMWDEPVVPAPAPGPKKPEPPPPGGKDYASSKAIEKARQAAADADRVGAELGGKFGKAIGDAQEALKTLNSLTAGALPRILKSNPDFVNELQSGLATKLNAIPELPTYSDPKLAEIARKGFERGFGSGLADAKLKAAAVRLAAEAALALSGNAAILAERAGATALKGALARLKDMPVFIPGAIDGGGALFRFPKPQIAQAAPGGARPRLYIDAAQATDRELQLASQLSKQGRGTVVVRDPIPGRPTSDLLIEGAPYDIYSPTTSNANRIISELAKKNRQASGVVLDLSRTSVTDAELGNVLARVRGAGATNIQDVIIIR
jgi:hypothetical protein